MKSKNHRLPSILIRVAANTTVVGTRRVNASVGTILLRRINSVRIDDVVGPFFLTLESGCWLWGLRSNSAAGSCLPCGRIVRAAWALRTFSRLASLHLRLDGELIYLLTVVDERGGPTGKSFVGVLRIK